MVTPGASSAVASRLTGRELTGERVIDAGRAGERVVVADEVVVRWLQPPVLSPHPGVELLQHATAHGFTDMPRFLGTETRDEMVHAVATEYVPGAADGWVWFVDDVDACLQDGSPPELMAGAARMGALTASLHASLTGLQRGTVASRTYFAQASERLDDAMRQVGGTAGERLRALEPAARAALAPLDTAELLTAHRIHGGLHVCRFLRAGDRLVISGFDDNSLPDSVERRWSHSPLLDVASLVQSLDHAGRVVVERHPGRAAEVSVLVAAAVGTVLDAYGPVDVAKLHALRVAHELHGHRSPGTHAPLPMHVHADALSTLLGAP